MKTTKPIVLLALVLLTAAAAQSAKKPAKKEISNTRTASCLVKITSDPAVLPLSDIIIDYLVHSSGVAGKAAREVLNISPDDAFQLFTIEDVAKYSAGGMPPSSTLPSPAGLPRSSSRSTTAAVRAPSAARTAAARQATPANPTTTPSRRPTTPAASPAPAAEESILFKLEVNLSEELDGKPIKPAAEEFMKAIIYELYYALNHAFDDYRNKIIGQLALAAEEADRAENKLVQMQNDLRNISDYRNLSRSVILKDISSLRRDMRDMEMEKASYRIEMDAIGKEIHDTEVKIRDKVKNDPITIELQRIVDIQTDSLKRTQELVKKGTASSDEVEDVLEKLARARIELAKRREEISKAEGGNRVSQLSSKLAQYTQRMAQYELSLSSTKEQLKEAMDFLDRADDYELLSLKADIARQSLQETLLWHERMERKTRSIQPPAVTILGGS